jgi:hypothetical protein
MKILNREINIRLNDLIGVAILILFLTIAYSWASDKAIQEKAVSNIYSADPHLRNCSIEAGSQILCRYILTQNETKLYNLTPGYSVDALYFYAQDGGKFHYSNPIFLPVMENTTR